MGRAREESMIIRFIAAVGLLAMANASPAKEVVTRRHIEVKRSGYGAPYVPGSRGVANSLVVLREQGGMAGMDRQTVIRLMGRVVRRGELARARTTRDVQIPGPAMRRLEKAARDSGFMRLSNRYAGPRIADGMTRIIRVTMQGKTKTVSVMDGAEVPAAFETVWKAANDAMRARGSVTK
jgi:hypothetical protein